MSNQLLIILFEKDPLKFGRIFNSISIETRNGWIQNIWTIKPKTTLIFPKVKNDGILIRHAQL